MRCEWQALFEKMEHPDNEKLRAGIDLEDIKALQKYEPFTRYYLRRQNEELAKQAVKVLEAELPAEQLLIEQKIYRSLLKARGQLEAEMTACRGILGISQGE